MSPSDKTIASVLKYAAIRTSEEKQRPILKPTETLSLRLVYVNTTKG